MVEALAFMIPNHPQALLCVALAIYFQTSTKKGRYLWATLFAIAAICTYQSYYAHLFILGLIALYQQNKGKFDKKLAVNAIKHIGIIIAGMATYFISVFAYCKIMNVEQAQSTTSNLSPLHLLRELLHVLRMAAENLWKGCGIYHLRGILIFILAAAAIYLLIKLIQSHKKQNIIYGILFIGVALVVPVAYGAVSTEFYLAPRILISYFTVLAGFLILALYYKPSTKTTIVITILLALFSAINVFQASSLITDIQISNAVELSELELIHKQIDIYEAESGQTIDTIVVYNTGRVGEMTFDQTHTNHPEGYNTSHLITSTEWSNVAWLQKVTGKPYRHIEKSTNDADFREVFPEYQTEQLTRFVPSERLKFDQNTLYWITY